MNTDPKIDPLFPNQQDGLEQFKADQDKYKPDQPLVFDSNAPGIDPGLKLPGDEPKQPSQPATALSSKPQVEQPTPMLNNNNNRVNHGNTTGPLRHDPFDGGNLIGPDQLNNFDPCNNNQPNNNRFQGGRQPQPRFDPYSPIGLGGDPNNDLDMPYGNNNLRRPNNNGPNPRGGFGGPPGGGFGGPPGGGGFGGPPAGGFGGFY